MPSIISTKVRQMDLKHVETCDSLIYATIIKYQLEIEKFYVLRLGQNVIHVGA